MTSVLQRHAYLLRGVVVLLSAILVITPLSAQDTPPATSQPAYHFNAYTKKDGMLTNSVWAIVQDTFGFIWLGADNGLYRFDGQTFLPFRHDPQDTNSISSNYITYFWLGRQHNLWIGTNNGLNRLNTETGQLDRIDLQTEGNLFVGYVLETRDQQIWIGTMRNGLYRLSIENDTQGYHIEQFEHDPEDPGTLGSSRIDFLIEDELGYVWAGYPTGIDRIDPQSGKARHFTHPLLAGGGNRVNHLALDGDGNVLMTFLNSGVFYIQPSSPQPQIRPYFPAQLQLPQPPGIIYTQMLIDQAGNFWLGTATHGLFLIDSARSNYKVLEHRPAYSGSLSSSDIRAIFEDRQGNIWIGTGDGGLNRGKKIPDQYRWFQHDPEQPGSLADGQVRAIAEGLDGNIWIGYLGQGLEQFAFGSQHQLVKKQSLQHRPQQANTLSSNDIINMITDPQGFLWIATNGGGLNKLDPRTGEIEIFRHDPEDPATISGDRIWAICVDQAGYIWLGTYWRGLCRLDPRTKTVKHFKHDPDNPNSLSSNLVNALLTDSDGYIWIGTDAGLDRMDPRTETLLHFHHVQQDPHSLTNNLIFSLHEGPGRQLWVGTSIGLNRLPLPDNQTKDTTNRFEGFYEKDGLPGNTIYSITSDQSGNLWVGTDNGLARLLPTQPKNTFALLNNEDGQEHAVYTPNAYLAHQKTGWLFFGNKAGLLAIHPDLLKQININSRLVLSSATKMRLKGSALESITDHFISAKPTISLNHRDQIITFDLSEIYWAEGRTYEYQLSGFNDQWIQAKDKMEITFTNLIPGNYALKARLKGEDNQAVEEAHLLDISVIPPWWKTAWAYSLYILLAASLIYALYRFQLNRKLEKQKTKNLQALDEFKNKLYTNITHEFRTPLTVISGMAEQIEQQGKVRDMIKRNSANLLNLVNQILDLRKMELGKLKLELIQADLVFYLQYIIASYEALAEMKEVNLHFIPKERELWMDFDKEKLLRIISNLLSNAIKFTPEGGDIYLQLGRSTLELMPGQSLDAAQISVADTGIGIPKDKQPFIFDRFYQVESDSATSSVLDKVGGGYQYRGPGGGTGIGMALTKELVTLMGGRIHLDSEPGKGTTFTVKLPITRQAPVADPFEEERVTSDISEMAKLEVESYLSPFVADPMSSEEGRLRLLIIEDNADLQQYLVSILKDHYNIQVARDGQEGLGLAFEQIPDLIISDVMMPRKDGFEVCETLKTDERTSHIPIILLTAKASVESRIEGLERGADAYLAKPFNQKELFIRLKKLHELRQLLQQRYQGLDAPQEPAGTDPTFRQEDAFINKLHGIVDANMGNPQFGVEEFCKAVGISRSQLHLKIKALTNRSTTHFIRAIRLHKAKELLQASSLNVSEAAYEVGFSDPFYFSRKFKEEFGFNPNSLAKK